MRNKIQFAVLLLPFSTVIYGQSPGISLRVADTLTPAEKKQPRTILRNELDSIIYSYQQARDLQAAKEPVVPASTKDNSSLPVAILALVGLLMAGMIYMFYRQKQQLSSLVETLREEKKEVQPSGNGPVANKKGKGLASAADSRMNELKSELLKLSKENESLQRVVKEYNGIQHEYDSLKHGILKAYKVKNYPGYDKSKDEVVAMKSVLNTENFVAAYAYEKFLKPILAIADANKNSPAKTAPEDREKLLDLLVSLSLLYIEYLYLRVNDLAIGGQMVERIQGLSKGNGLDPALLKKLDTEFGSRALVIKMALDKAGLQKLAYPVFDETNLNNP
ncbi:MAG: hypothetical protein ACXWC7_18275 [Chitinophagaceae bacterium]